MSSIVTNISIAMALSTIAPAEWVPFRWQAPNGPRDIEYLQSSVKVESGVMSVSVRRERALALKQDPSIAPETNPWTAMDLQVRCEQAQWRLVTATAVNDSGRVVSTQSSASWLPIEPATLAGALRTRLCPSA